MQYKEIQFFDIKNNPEKVQCILTDNAHHLSNELYILAEGNHFKFDTDTLNSLNHLKLRIESILKKY